MVDTTPPFGLPYWVAHTPSKLTPRFHKLKKHILRVSEMASEFAVPLNASEIAYSLGLLHDLGKFREDFQNYLLQCYCASKNKTVPPAPGSAPHKQAGALAVEMLIGEKVGQYLSLLIFGHHGGMLSPGETARKIREKTDQAEVGLLLERAAAVDGQLRWTAPNLTPLHSFENDAESLEMYLRMIYSCLVDADGLDTEAHNDPEAADRRNRAVSPSLQEMSDQLCKRQREDFASKSGIVNNIRREVYDTCIQAAESVPGFFTLTVPTGGGKTRSSLAFALAHAARHKLRRIIYAIPYTSIVDQTAAAFRDLFGIDAGIVLEHHSAIDQRQQQPSKDNAEEDDEGAAKTERWRKLAAQNWDAPVVVTTTVQLFESLFSNRPSACRKLHRLAGSVIVLDEAQCLPYHLLAPIRSGLKTLVEHFGATVVFCTATQPAHDLEMPHLQGLTSQPIVTPERQQAHFAALKRVRYRIEKDPWNWERTAAEMRGSGQSCLCILNTRRQALNLLDVLDPNGDDPDVLHLSTLLCGRHRRDVLSEVRKRLKEGRRILLVSTQVVEAGVDFDFPMVLRAVGPLDRIIQAAGRCNREGLRPVDDSHVVVFTPEDGASPRGIYRMTLDRTVRLLGGREEADLDDPAFVTRYFLELYRDLALDPKAIGKRVSDLRTKLRYDEVAREVRLIEQDTVGVFVTNYSPEEAQPILEEASRIGHMTRELWQRAQPFCVALPYHEVHSDKLPIDETTVAGLLLWRGIYDAKRGLPLSAEMSDSVYVPDSLITNE